MTHVRSTGVRALRALRGCAVATLITCSSSAQDDWTRHFRVGMQIGLNLKADFSMTGSFGISGSQPGATGANAVDHFYDDGYVRVDQTGNTRAYTSFWGYNNASQ